MSLVTASLSRVPHTTATEPPRKGERCHVTLLIVGPFGNCLLTRYVPIGWRYIFLQIDLFSVLWFWRKINLSFPLVHYSIIIIIIIIAVMINNIFSTAMDTEKRRRTKTARVVIGKPRHQKLRARGFLYSNYNNREALKLAKWNVNLLGCHLRFVLPKNKSYLDSTVDRIKFQPQITKRDYTNHFCLSCSHSPTNCSTNIGPVVLQCYAAPLILIGACLPYHIALQEYSRLWPPECPNGRDDNPKCT